MVVEAKVFPRVKLCGGLMTGKAQDALRQVLGEAGQEECLQACTASHERKFSLWQHAADGSMHRQVMVEPRRPILLVDRPKFDRWMFDRCRATEGVQVLEGDGVTDIDFDRHVVTLASGRQITYSRLVAADGANSVVERLMAKRKPRGWQSRKTRCADSFCLEVNVDRADCPDVEGVCIYFGVVPESYAWAFAKGNQVCLGLVKLSWREFDVRETFLRFLREVGVRNVEKYVLRGAMLPFGNPMRCPSVDALDVVFAGDAAGLVEPLTGEGIYYALQSGLWAGKCAASEYVEKVHYLHRLIRKGGGYQRVLLYPPILRFVCRHADHHRGFFEHFYSTQIEQGCLDSFPVIVWKYFH